MRNHLTVCFCVLLALVANPDLGLAQEVEAPETFIANAQVLGKEAGASAEVTIHVERYTEERHRTTMLNALRDGGYPNLLKILRTMPEVGYVEMNGRKVSVMWARQVATGKGRTISIVTDRPLAFVGGAAIDPKPRAGYELAILQFEVDSVGIGRGSMAAAARVKPGGETGVQVDDYAEAPIKLVTVRKSFKTTTRP